MEAHQQEKPAVSPTPTVSKHPDRAASEVLQSRALEWMDRKEGGKAEGSLNEKQLHWDMPDLEEKQETTFPEHLLCSPMLGVSP